MTLEEKNEKKTAHIDGKKCIGCGGCKRNCEYDAISKGSEFYIVDPAKCVGCMACIEMCPAEAISYV